MAEEKKEVITITASFKTRTKEGDRITHKYSGSGKTVVEAIADVKGSDSDLTDEFNKPFPARINLLVNTTVTRGSYRFERAIAPHTANAIFAGDAQLMTKLFGL